LFWLKKAYAFHTNELDFSLGLEEQKRLGQGFIHQYALCIFKNGTAENGSLVKLLSLAHNVQWLLSSWVSD